MKLTLEWLKSKDVLTRGRCGAFSQQAIGIDDSFIQGVEAVDFILHGTPEHCLNGDLPPPKGTAKSCMPKFGLKSSLASPTSTSQSIHHGRYRGGDDDDDSDSSNSSCTDTSSVYTDGDDDDDDADDEAADDGASSGKSYGSSDRNNDSGLESKAESL